MRADFIARVGRVQRRLTNGVERICFDRHPAARYRLPVAVILGGSGDTRPGWCLAPPGHFLRLRHGSAAGNLDFESALEEAAQN
jgi:hypothetical protein